MLTLVVFVVAQVRVELPPGPIDVGAAVRVMVGAAAATVTVTLWVALPPAPVAVAVKVVVVLMTTVVDPESASEVWSSPRMLGVTVNVVAFVVDHVRVTMEPAVTEVALDVNVSVGGALVTVMLIVSFVVPPGPVAVAVYVVLALTVTCCDPASGNVPDPIEGAMVTEVAFFDDQVSVTAWPELTLVESAVKESVGAGGWVGFELEPLPPQAVKSATRPRTVTRYSRRRDTWVP